MPKRGCRTRPAEKLVPQGAGTYAHLGRNREDLRDGRSCIAESPFASQISTAGHAYWVLLARLRILRIKGQRPQRLRTFLASSNGGFAPLLKSSPLTETVSMFDKPLLSVAPVTLTSNESTVTPRGGVSVTAVAEGFGRWHSKEFIHFLLIANGSLKELETHSSQGV